MLLSCEKFTIYDRLNSTLFADICSPLFGAMFVLRHKDTTADGACYYYWTDKSLVVTGTHRAVCDYSCVALKIYSPVFGIAKVVR